MSKIKNTWITDKRDFRHTCYVATAAQNLKDFCNSSLWTCSHLMAILKSQNKNTIFLDNFSLIVPHKVRKNTIPLCPATRATLFEPPVGPRPYFYGSF